jgi:hypothetical protein
MRIAIVHYHLRPGGVTRVIQNALTALGPLTGSGNRVVVIAGEPPSPAMPVAPYAVVAALGYQSAASAAQVLKDVEAAAVEQLGGAPDVWHIHNHALGKNAVLPELVAQLARRGRRLLLQPHDFAEDGRPTNYQFLRAHCPDSSSLGEWLYPQGAHIHYALINQRDLRFLQQAGVNSSQLHYLPNAVSLDEAETTPESPENTPGREKLVLYPARAIRRKNLGEFLLWAALAQDDELFAIARAPQNPEARPIYEAWVAFAQSLNLPVEFALGERWSADFSSLLRAAHTLLTTSVAEGFGLAYLEPWLAWRPLVGRDLSEVTEALKQTGLDLSGLYQRLDVPLEWVGRERFRQAVTAGLEQVYTAYGKTVQSAEIEQAVNAAVWDEQVDFGKLDEVLQRTVIERAARSAGAATEIAPARVTPVDIPDAQIEHNRRLICERFNLTCYGDRLRSLYQTVATSDIAAWPACDAHALLTRFLAPQRFCLLRT